MRPKPIAGSRRRSIPRASPAVGLPAVFLVAVLSLVSDGAAADSVIWERGDQIVLLAKQDDPSSAPNGHPYNTTTAEVAAMLEAVQLRYADEEADAEPVAAFTKEELENLSAAVASGLGRAAPSEDILFHMIGARRLSRGAFARRNRVSAGRIFYRDGGLNIIFGQVQTPYRKKNIYGQIEQDFYPRNYGSRTTPVKHDVVLLTNASVRLKENDAGARDDWIVIDPKSVSLVAGQPLGSSESRPARAAEPATSAPVLAERAAGAPQPAAKGNEVSGGQSAAVPEPEPPPATDVERRLEALKRLRERGLISEEAYQSKMNEILEDL